MRQEWDEDGVNYQLDFFYDTQGKPLAVIYRQNGNGLSYYYLTNQQGDVTKLYKPVPVTGSTTVNMVEIATYSYDPWGKATVTVNTGSQITNNDRTLASINPLRYRGYYQDVETGFYYLQSRYYDPVIGRFINADLPEYAALSATDITGTNLFAYCGNDPVNHADGDGEFWHIVIGAVVGAVVGAASQVYGNIISGKKLTNGLAVAAGTGALSGALSATGVGVIGSVLGNAAISIAGETANQAISHASKGTSFDVGRIAIEGLHGAISGAIGGAGASGSKAGFKAMNQAGRQTVKRASRAFKYGGIRKFTKEASKAWKYYRKNTKYITESMFSKRSIASWAYQFAKQHI